MGTKAKEITVAIAAIWALYSCISPVQAQEEVLEQWAFAVVNVSSRPISHLGGADHATGAPNTECETSAIGNFDGFSWRAGQPDDGEEWIELRYSLPVWASAIEVYESFNPGAITALSVLDEHGQWLNVWKGEDENRACPSTLRIEFPRLEFSTRQVRLELDTAKIPGWNQIDAVKLVGIPDRSFTTYFSPLTDDGAIKQGEERRLPATTVPYTMGDYDNDGWPDLFALNNVEYPLSVMLLHNEANSTFDLRNSDLPMDTMVSNGGKVWGDYDNDGDLDLFVAWGSTIRLEFAGRDLLLRNDRGVFRDVAEEAGLNDELISTIGIWLDYNNDGNLDLYVGHGLEWTVDADYPHPNKLYRNMGDGTFVDATEEAGLPLSFHAPGTPLEKTWGTTGALLGTDLNGDRWTDLYVTVAEDENRLFFNDGMGGFRETTSSEIRDSGVGSGATVADIDNDGDLDIFQANIASDPTSGNDIEARRQRSIMLLNLGEGEFIDVTEGVGLAALTANGVAAARFIDIDNDGDMDLTTSWDHLLFLNQGDGTFVEDTFKSGLAGLEAMGDFDDDGFMDVWFIDGLYRNNANTNHYLRIRPTGVQSTRDGIGVQVIARSGDWQQMQTLLGGDGWYQAERVIHFGLGDHTQVDQLEIRWPSGQTDIIDNIPADQEIRIIEGHNEWYPAPRTTWTQEPPAEITFGREVEFSAQMRPTLFEPTATITSIIADLSSLGGPADVPLENLGDGTYGFSETFTVGGESALRDVEVLVLQETSLGEHWINLSRNIDVKGDPFTAVLEDYSDALPETFTLHQNHPNPFNSGTVIRFALPQAGKVELSVYNLAGQKVTTLVEGTRLAGEYAINWDGKDEDSHALATGIYLYRLQTSAKQQTRKLLLLR